MFDFHASIKRLAEAEWECPDEGENVGWKGPTRTNPSMVHTEFGYRPFQDTPHRVCGGAGRITPFATLRVECTIAAKHGDTYHTRYGCKNRRWIPEPDVEKACEVIIECIWQQPAKLWHTFWAILEELQQEISCEFQEAVLRAAEAWLKEKP